MTLHTVRPNKLRLLLTLTNNGVSHSHIERRGDLYIFAVAFDKCDWVAKSFHDACIVSKGVAIRLLVSSAQEVKRKHLGRLHQAEKRAVESERGSCGITFI